MPRPRTVSDEDILEAARRCTTTHGPGVSLAVIGKEVGVSAPALVKRFGSKERLLFQALLPRGRPAWATLLAGEPGPDAHDVLLEVLVSICRDFEQVGPALAALRMSPHDVERVFPLERPGPPRVAREALARWLGALGVREPKVAADVLAGAAEARGFLSWVGPQMVADEPTEAWAARCLAWVVSKRHAAPE